MLYNSLTTARTQMNSTYILWPVLAQVLLTLMMFTVLGVRKAKAVKAGAIDREQTALNNRAWTQDVVKVSNNIANQFEFPVLFYILCLMLYMTNTVDLTAIALAWAFTLSRYAHAYVHIGSNTVPLRLRLFLVGCLVLIAMFLLVAWKLTTSA